MSRLLGPAVLLAGCTAFSTPARAQEMREITAEEAMENYRATWSVDEPVVDTCAEEVADADTIVVCRRRDDPEKYMVEREVDPRMNETASGAPRAPNVDTIPPCGTPPGGFGVARCSKLGSAPEPVLMVDVESFPEPLSPDEAAKVFAVPEGGSLSGPAP